MAEDIEELKARAKELSEGSRLALLLQPRLYPFQIAMDKQRSQPAASY